MRRRGTLSLTIGAAAIVLAACGGSSQPAGTTTGTTSFKSQANAICKSINTRISAVSVPNSSALTASNLPAFARYFQETIPIAEKGTADLQALTPPAGQQGHLAALVKGDQAQVADAQAAEQAASRGDLAGFEQAVKKLQTDGSAGNSGALAAGLTECASAG